ncbi:class I SAM-dependent methyltransferase [Agromyces kandeliae]|uniref:Methyltransferase domain-containing protein n=1 Tax=Agromyces kandeliae TaxID=2666141 RepID=A0A6L5R1T6_9MICO|nr:class I SAM-dependent methyltransferase [Agromyces kandeliae]MRX43930.1 methyltransferase domain-containing protein [Agromyces kandeliae]
MSVTDPTPPAPGAADPVDAFADRIFTSALGAFETLSVHLGDRLDWYRILAERGSLTSSELAEAAETGERYTREWLEHQAVSGILAVDDADAAASDRRYSLPPAHAEVLTDDESLAYLAPIARIVASAAAQLPGLLDAARTGGGVPWASFGKDMRDAQGDINRPWFDRELAGALASVPELDAVLSRPGARILDVGCGHGWSSLALARAYPEAVVDGVDIDGPSIESARAHADEAELADRVTFHLGGGEALAEEDAYDAAFVFEALHDMPNPVEVLAALRRVVRDDGAVVIMDEAVAERFAPDGDDVERVMYGYSLLVCLPDSLSTPGSVATGTVMRPSTLEGYARSAGFDSAEALPIEGFAAFRFTRLHP